MELHNPPVFFFFQSYLFCRVILNSHTFTPREFSFILLQSHRHLPFYVIAVTYLRRLQEQGHTVAVGPTWKCIFRGPASRTWNVQLVQGWWSTLQQLCVLAPAVFWDTVSDGEIAGGCRRDTPRS